MMRTVLSLDARHAVRQLSRTPAFSAAIVLTLAVGIGATSAVFAVVYGVLLRPLPFHDADRLVTIWSYNPANTFSGSRGLGGERAEPLAAVSPPFFRELRPRLGAVEGLAGLSPSWPVSVTGRGDPEVMDAAYITSTLLTTLALQPRLGRDFNAVEHAPNGPRVAIVSEGVWRSRFGGGALGDETIDIDGERHAIVGVMPAGVSMPNTSAEILLPFALNPFYARADVPVTFVIGRLARGTTRADAAREVERVGRDLRPELRALRGETLALVPLRDRVAAGSRRISLVLFGAVALLTLIGCVNVSNLLLSRHASRAHEIATRAALGATRTRLVSQLLIESLALGLAGCVAGLFLAWVLVGYLRIWLGSALPVGVPIVVDRGVLAFSFAASLLAGVVAGTAPAWHAARQDVVTALRGMSRGIAGGDARIRGLLIGMQVALAVVLVSGAALLARSLITLSAVDPGFRVENLATGGFALPGARYPRPADRAAFVRTLEDRLASIPGVLSAGFVNRLPLGGAPNNIVPIEAEGFAARDGQPLVVDRRVATPQYFSTIALPLLRGRVFGPPDQAGAPLVAVVNRAMAHSVWGGADPLGRRLRIAFGSRTAPWVTIVGIVGDLRHTGLDAAPRPEFYVPYAQSPVESMAAVVRGQGPAEPLVAALRKTIWSVDPELPVSDATTMAEVVARSVAAPRSRTLLLSMVALVALILSAVGIAGVAAYAASRMRRDLGIRMAFGATRRHVRRLVAKRVLVPAAAGAAAGIALSFGAGRALRAFLFEIPPGDPLTILLAVAAVSVCAWAAVTLPAWRAARADPMSVLRE